MKKSIEFKLKFRKYEFYPDKILFKTKVSCGRIRVHPTLENFAYLDKAYVKIYGGIKSVNLHEYYDRKTRQLNGYVSVRLNRKFVEVYVKTKPEFAIALKNALKSKQKLSVLFQNGTRLYVNKPGKLLMKLLVATVSKIKSHSEIHNFLKGKNKSIFFETLIDFVKRANLNENFLAPFVENYYVAVAKKELTFPNNPINLSKNIYRTIGLINGDGHLSSSGVFFYNKNKQLHGDFKLGINIINSGAELKENEDYNGLTRTYVYSVKLVKKLKGLGVIFGNKLISNEPIEIPNNFYALSEYLGGIFDTEGSIIGDHNLVISNCASIHQQNFGNSISDEEYRFLLNIAESKGTPHYFPTGYKYYRIGLKTIKSATNLIKEKILTKAKSSPSTLLNSTFDILKSLGINAKKELKYFLVYPNSKKVNAVWWIEISHIEDVIKFASIIRIHHKEKREKIRYLIKDYVTKTDLDMVIGYVKESLVGWENGC